MKIRMPPLWMMLLRTFFSIVAIPVIVSLEGSISAAPNPPPAAASCATTITQSSSQEITPGNAISCNTGDPNYYHLDVSYWRAFNMAAFANSQQYNVTSVSFGIEAAHSGNGMSQPATIRLYANVAAPFPGGLRTQVASKSIGIPDQVGTIMSVPVFATVPAGTLELVMELFTPSGVLAGNSFFVGTNTAAQTGPSYVSAAACGTQNPTDVAALGFPDSHIVFSVHGSCSSGPPTPATSLNISTRMRVATGDSVMIGGFIVTGGSTSLVLRGVGPSLAVSGVTDALADPQLELRGSNGMLLSQDNNWQDDPTQAGLISGAGLALQDPLEAGIAATLGTGAYTAILSGTNQTSGVGLVEVYNTGQSGARLGNISTRGFVEIDNNVMIGGFILGGSNGSARVAIRGIGPSLAQGGVSNPLANPTLELHDASGTTLAVNDNWLDDGASAAQLSANGLGLQNNLESGIFITLPPGAFTAILAGKDGGTGVGLVEAYNLQ